MNIMKQKKIFSYCLCMFIGLFYFVTINSSTLQASDLKFKSEQIQSQFLSKSPNKHLYFSRDDNSNGLYILDTQSGEATHIGRTGVITSSLNVGLSPSPEQGILYGSKLTTLLHIKTNGTGYTDVGGVATEGLARDGSKLYGIRNRSFFTMNPETGEKLTQLSVPDGDIEGIAYCPTDGFIYGLAGSGGPRGNLYRYDIDNDSWTLLGDTGVEFSYCGLACDSEGVLYAKGSQDSNLYHIYHNPVGSAVAGDTGIEEGGGLAFGFGELPKTFCFQLSCFPEKVYISLFQGLIKGYDDQGQDDPTPVTGAIFNNGAKFALYSDFNESSSLAGYLLFGQVNQLSGSLVRFKKDGSVYDVSPCDLTPCTNGNNGVIVNDFSSSAWNLSKSAVEEPHEFINGEQGATCWKINGFCNQLFLDYNSKVNVIYGYDDDCGIGDIFNVAGFLGSNSIMLYSDFPKDGTGTGDLIMLNPKTMKGPDLWVHFNADTLSTYFEYRSVVPVYPCPEGEIVSSSQKRNNP